MSAVRETKLQEAALEEDIRVDSASDKLAGYFYKIANHEELFKIGRGFLKEVEKGVGSFAFTSTGYKNSQQRTILGLCCFFDQNANYKIAIISDHLTRGVFSDLVESSTSENYHLGNGGDVVEYKSFHHHFDFIEYAELIKLYESHLNTKTFDEQVAKVLENYDVVLWDVPEMEHVKEHANFHYRISHFYESMTVIISQYASTGKHVESIKNFFSNYNINLNKVLFDTWETREQTKRKKFLGIF